MIYPAFISGIEFLTNAGWWGLLGLLVPLIIHFLSKKEKNIIQFGSLRFLQPIESDSAKSIQLSQYLLLLSRLLLVGLICLLLLGPFIKTEITAKTIWVEENIYNSKDYQGLWADLPEDQVINLFSHEESDSIGVHYYKSIWTFINQLNNSADSSVVYSYSLQRNFIGAPVLLSPKVDWNIVPYKYEADNRALPKSVSSDQRHIAISNQESLSDQVLIIQLIDNGFDKEGAQIKKVIESSKDYLPYDIEWITPNSISDKSKIWSINIGTSENNNERLIHWIPSERKLEVESVDERALNLSGKIDRENILDTNLPVRLATMFNNDMTNIYDYDIRVMHPDNLAHTSVVPDTTISENVALATSSEPLHSYVLLLIIPAFLLERFLNYKNVER